MDGSIHKRGFCTIFRGVGGWWYWVVPNCLLLSVGLSHAPRRWPMHYPSRQVLNSQTEWRSPPMPWRWRIQPTGNRTFTVRRSMGNSPNVSVKGCSILELESRSSIEISDLDNLKTQEEVMEHIKKAIPDYNKSRAPESLDHLSH